MRYYNYKKMYEGIREQLLNADEVGPRGMKTKELLNVQFTLLNPRDRLIYHKDRKFNLAFAIAEAMTIINGTNDVQFLSKFNKNVAQFSDNGNTFYGAYGPRLEPFWVQLINKLKSDKDTRQAVMTIYESKDMTPVTKDMPCTIALHFMIRKNRLNLTAYMRSNDFFWGTQYDVFVFTLIQELIADILGINVGTYTHNATSMHVYQRHYDMLEKVEKCESVIMPQVDQLPNYYSTLENYCRYVIDFGANELDNNILKGRDFLFYSILANKLGCKFNIETTADAWALKFMKKNA